MADHEPVPDSGMDTGSEEGEPGGTTDATPLTDEERAILERLQRSGHREVAAQPPEESPVAGEAAEDDAPLPDYAPPERDRVDPLDPIFREPDP
ncbi:MAG TPA: hypothetical protein VEL73_02515 [Mycobacteriales bacterium]|nr:hypothetical protein [Mycobacteriales bacterium]